MKEGKTDWNISKFLKKILRETDEGKILLSSLPKRRLVKNIQSKYVDI